MNFIEKINSLSKIFICETGGADNVVSPLYDAVTLIGPYAIGVVLVLCIIYGVILGVKYAKIDDAKDRAELQKVIKNFVIGALTVMILLLVLYAIRLPLTRWMDTPG